MKTIARQKLYEQFGESLGSVELKARQTAIARAWLDGFEAAETEACPYNGELADIWRVGKLEAEKRAKGAW